MSANVGRVRIRPVADGDRAGWGALWTDYLAFYHAALSPEVHDAQFARLRRGDDFVGLVAEDDAGLVGIAHCIVHGDGWRLQPVCYLQDLYAAPRVRGSGVGRALIEAVYAMATARGAPHVYWMTDDANATARRLYDRIGTLTPYVKYVRPQ